MSKEMPESMMNIKGVIGVAALLAAFAPAPVASAQNMTLQQVYAQMDLSAAKFQSVQADISVDRYTARRQARRPFSAPAAPSKC
jgi:hypothetical protein